MKLLGVLLVSAPSLPPLLPQLPGCLQEKPAPLWQGSSSSAGLQPLLQGLRPPYKLHLTKGTTSSVPPGFYHQLTPQEADPLPMPRAARGVTRRTRTTGSAGCLSCLTPFYKIGGKRSLHPLSYPGEIFCWLLCVVEWVQFDAGRIESAVVVPCEIFRSLLGPVQHPLISVGSGICFTERARSQSSEYVRSSHSSVCNCGLFLIQ